MAGISFPGIGSGIDGSALAGAVYDQLTTSNIVRKNNVSDLQSENTSLEKLRSLLIDVSDKLDSARTANGGADTKSAKTTNASVATAVAGSDAQTGSYTVNVLSLANTASGSFEKSFGSAISFLISDPGQAGSVDFSVGTGDSAASFSVYVDETTTAEDFAASFNNAAGAKAAATLVNVGTTDSPSYKISFSTTGVGTEKGSLSVSSSNAEIFGSGALGTTTVNQASDAQFSVTGISGTITRSSNTVSDVISGVTFQLASAGSATITVVDDGQGTKSKIADFVTAYNSLVKFASKEDAITTTQGQGEATNTYGSLTRTNVDDDALAALRSAIGEGRSADGSTSLASLGVSTNRDGTLSFDEKAFDTAYQKSPSAANEALSAVADRVSGVQGSVYQYTGYGLAIDQATKANESQIKSLNETIDRVERSASSSQAAVLKQFTNLESLISKLNADSGYISSLLKF